MKLKKMIDLNKLEGIASKLIALLKDPHHGLMTWNHALKENIDEFLQNIVDEDDPGIKVAEFKVEAHNEIDKSFDVTGKHISMRIDYDDVDHAETDAAVDVLKHVLEHHWNETMFKERFRHHVTEEWNRDQYIREEYPDLNVYLKERGAK